MKNQILIFLSFITVQLALAQDWQLQNPLPQDNSLFSISFPDGLTGYAAGEYGTIVKTSDGGSTWTVLHGVTSGTLQSVYFTSANTGYIVGVHDAVNFQVILRTIDGGITWDSIPTGTTYPLLSVFFPTANVGYAVGSTSMIFKTTDAGNSWTAISIVNTGSVLNSVYFPNALTGYAAGNDGTIIKTDDGGISWTTLPDSTTGNLYSIHFTDTLHGYAAGYKSGRVLILKTADGGDSWVNVSPDTTGYLHSVSFQDSLTGYAVGYSYVPGTSEAQGLVLKTTNGGVTWECSLIRSTIGLTSLSSTAHNRLFAAGYGGKIIKTTDGGLTWEDATMGTTRTLTSQYFTDALTGYATGYYGTILKTADGGAHWLALSSGTTHDLWSVFFTSPAVGCAVGSMGTILRTTDAGQSWTRIMTGDSSYLQALFFVDQNTGYAAGTSTNYPEGTTLKTTDGGLTWSVYHSLNPITSLYFTGPTTGYAVDNISGPNGNSLGRIYKTNNGGVSWNKIFSESYCGLNSIFFTDENTGYTVGGGYYFSAWGGMYKTRDAGATWVELPYNEEYLNSVCFTDFNTGFAAGGNGTILKTTDGGVSWTPLSSGTHNYLYSVFFADGNTGYVAGQSGTILKTTNGGTGIQDGNGKEHSFVKLYPNPAGEILCIELPGSIRTFTGSITVYGMYGQEIIRQTMRSPLVTIDVSALSTGLYFLGVSGYGFTGTGKFIKK